MSSGAPGLDRTGQSPTIDPDCLMVAPDEQESPQIEAPVLPFFGSQEAAALEAGDAKRTKGKGKRGTSRGLAFSNGVTQTIRFTAAGSSQAQYRYIQWGYPFETPCTRCLEAMYERRLQEPGCVACYKQATTSGKAEKCVNCVDRGSCTFYTEISKETRVALRRVQRASNNILNKHQNITSEAWAELVSTARDAIIGGEDDYDSEVDEDASVPKTPIRTVSAKRLRGIQGESEASNAASVERRVSALEVRMGNMERLLQSIDARLRASGNDL